jgi:PAS domain-containing protein
MIGILLLQISLARKQSKQHATVFISITGILTLILVIEFFVLIVPGILNKPTGIIMSVIKLVLILLSSCFLVIFHIKLRINFLDLEEKFHKVVNTSRHGMMIVKVSYSTILDVNSAFSRVSGYSAEEVTGKTTLGLGLWHDPEQRKEVISVLMNFESFGPVEYKFIPKTGLPTKYL